MGTFAEWKIGKREGAVEGLKRSNSPLFRHSILPFFHLSIFGVQNLFCFLFFAIFALSADAALTVHVRDDVGNPVSPVRVLIFPGALDPDSDVEPIAPPEPRADGVIGFVTDERGRVRVDLPDGNYTVVASPDLDSGLIDESFVIIREVSTPEEVTISTADTVPVTVSAVGEGNNAAGPQPLVAARVYFRPSKRALGYVGLLNNNGQLQTAISPGRYHVVLSGSIALHYVVLADQVISPPSAAVSFNGLRQPTARLAFDLPQTTRLVLHEVLSTDISYEFVDVIESAIGYDAAYTGVLSIASGRSAGTLRLLTGLTYQLNLSYVVDLDLDLDGDGDGDGVFYAYELRINALEVDGPRSFLIGNSGTEPFRLSAQTDRSEYRPGQPVTVRYEIFDTRGNQLYRFFNFSGARLLFPFVVVRDPNGAVVGSNPITNELPEDFFRFEFRLPRTDQPGLYTINVSLDAKMYGRLEDNITFRVVSEGDASPPRISNLNAPTKGEAKSPIKISAQIEDESGLNRVSLHLSLPSRISGQSPPSLTPRALPNNRYEWEIPANFVSPSLGRENLRWRMVAVDAFDNQSREAGEIVIRDTTAPTIAHDSIQVAEIGRALPIEAKVADNLEVAAFVVSYGDGVDVGGEAVGHRVTQTASRS